MVVSMRGEGGERIDNLRAAQVARTQMERRTAGQRRGHVALGNDAARKEVAQQGQQGRVAPARRAQPGQTPYRITAGTLTADTHKF